MKRIIRITITAALILAMSASFSACHSKDEDTTDTSETTKTSAITDDMAEESTMTVNIKDGETEKNGWEHYSYQVEDGKTGSVKITIIEGEGSVDVKIFSVGNEDSPVYTGKELPPSEFEVVLSEAGDYEVWIENHYFTGSCGIEYSQISAE